MQKYSNEVNCQESGNRAPENAVATLSSKSVFTLKSGRTIEDNISPLNNHISFTFSTFDLLCLISAQTDDDDHHFLANSWLQCIITGLLS